MSNPALSVLWQNDDLTVLNKPSGLSVLADRQTQENLWTQLRREIGKPYLVHRLDKGTSGVLLVARNAATQQHLTRAFANRAVDKYYLCWVVGEVALGHSLHIQLPLCRGRKSRYRVAAPRDQIVLQNHTYLAQADRDHVTALTYVRCLTHYQGRSLLLAKPVTGRTHQLRVHLSWIGHPIIGDHLYGKPKDPRQQHSRLLLHCHRLVVPGERRFTAPLPEDISAPF